MAEVYHAIQHFLFPSKTCVVCHHEHPLENFYKSKSGKDGYENRCKQCRSLAQRARYIAKSGKAQETVSVRRAVRTPRRNVSGEERRSRQRAACKAYHLANLEKERARRRAYYAANREKIRQEQNEKNRLLAAERKLNEPVVFIREGHKVCADCGQEKPFNEFYKASETKDGYRYSCKECCDKSSGRKQIGKLRNRRNQTVTPGYKWCHGCQQEKLLEQFNPDKTKRDGLHPRCKDCHAAFRHAFWEENKERLTQLRKEWYAKPENRLKILEQNRRRLGHIFTYDPVDYGRILERDGSWCYICESAILPEHEIEFDHVTPLVPMKGTKRKPGPHTEDNIKIAHKTCNRRKHNRLLEEMTPFQRRGV